MYLTIQEVADRLKVSYKAVYKLIVNHQLLATNVTLSAGRATWRIKEDDLNAFLELGQNKRPSLRRRNPRGESRRNRPYDHVSECLGV